MPRKITWIALLAAVTALAAAGTTAARPAEATAPKLNIVQTAVKAGQFKTLVKLVKRAGLVGALSSQKSRLTVFAPTDAAFAKVPKATLAALMANRAKLRSVLLYHVVKGRVPASRVTMLSSAPTLAGETLAFSIRNGGVYVNDARVIKTDVGARNGIIHVVDSVLVPAG